MKKIKGVVKVDYGAHVSPEGNEFIPYIETHFDDSSITFTADHAFKTDKEVDNFLIELEALLRRMPDMIKDYTQVDRVYGEEN